MFTVDYVLSRGDFENVVIFKNHSTFHETLPVSKARCLYGSVEVDDFYIMLDGLQCLIIGITLK